MKKLILLSIIVFLNVACEETPEDIELSSKTQFNIIQQGENCEDSLLADRINQNNGSFSEYEDDVAVIYPEGQGGAPKYRFDVQIHSDGSVTIYHVDVYPNYDFVLDEITGYISGENLVFQDLCETPIKYSINNVQ